MRTIGRPSNEHINSPESDGDQRITEPKKMERN